MKKTETQASKQKQTDKILFAQNLTRNIPQQLLVIEIKVTREGWIQLHNVDWNHRFPKSISNLATHIHLSPIFKNVIYRVQLFIL